MEKCLPGLPWGVKGVEGFLGTLLRDPTPYMVDGCSGQEVILADALSISCHRERERERERERSFCKVCPARDEVIAPPCHQKSTRIPDYPTKCNQPT